MRPSLPFAAFALLILRPRFAGAWSVLNMHELAVTSGFAAAYRLGADFPFKGDDECERLFRLYLALSHGFRMVRVRFIIGKLLRSQLL